MLIRKLEDVAKSAMAMEGAKDVVRQVPISGADESPAFSFRVFTIGPGGHTPFHTHDWEHLNYIISGEGAIVTENGSEREIRQGAFALVLPGEKHRYRNTSPDQPLVMICAVPKAYE
jgi:quercetin dioxygenase-like cupin family protein